MCVCVCGFIYGFRYFLLRGLYRCSISNYKIVKKCTNMVVSDLFRTHTVQWIRVREWMVEIIFAMARDVRCFSRSQRSTRGDTEDKNAKKQTRYRQTEREKNKVNRIRIVLDETRERCTVFLHMPSVHDIYVIN